MNGRPQVYGSGDRLLCKGKGTALCSAEALGMRHQSLQEGCGFRGMQDGSCDVFLASGSARGWRGLPDDLLVPILGC